MSFRRHSKSRSRRRSRSRSRSRSHSRGRSSERGRSSDEEGSRRRNTRDDENPSVREGDLRKQLRGRDDNAPAHGSVPTDARKHVHARSAPSA
ncbi:hypothetical protein BT96DRAFT_922460 [Gymnopus androsaceus JB14]|uniref:Uncharacterized protein n=1 Tax=Gymnopus androsaceus JB14 TaxID=1447944 RepID=A0A6A4HGD0_9AGAR|nr:hypothetical protein BT96DRAFT_922460 [Gymnopus androsaceus JB14]